MRTRLSVPGFLVLFSVLAFHYPAHAGQVVTDDISRWAKETVRQEKGLSAPPAPNSVAVVYFSNTSGQPDFDPLRKGLALMLITDLAKVKTLQVVERVRLQAILDELKLGASGLVEPDTEPRVGRLLGAHWVVGGQVERGRKDPLRIESGVLDVPLERTTGRPDAEGVLEELFRLEKELLFKIVDYLKIEPTPEERVELEKPLTTDTRALLDLFCGIEMSDRKKYAEAARCYQGAIDKDPKLTIARNALKELRDLGLLASKDKSRDLLRSLREETSLTDQVSPKGPVRREIGPGLIRPRN